MTSSAAQARLEQIPVDRIDRNPDNPRLIFRPSDLEELLESIRVYGVQVPISVYKEGRRYVLIDGERRWRCASKLNHRTIPAVVQSKPTSLENLLLMFNIHSLREQWDLLTIALKLPRVIELLLHSLGRKPTEAEIAERTGLNRGLIRRCKLLMALPQHHKDQILDELKKPKSQQKITEDLFIEMERALTTVERAMPEAIKDREQVRQVLLEKYKREIIVNRVQFRNIGKIARAYKVGVDPDIALRELLRLFKLNSYSISDAFENSVSEAYKERDIGTRVQTLLNLLEDLELDDLEDDVREKLEQLMVKLTAMLAS